MADLKELAANNYLSLSVKKEYGFGGCFLPENISDKRLRIYADQTVDYYQCATMDNLKISKDSLRLDYLQCFAVANNLLKVKVNSNAHNINIEIEGKLHECERTFRQVLKEKRLYFEDCVHIEYPVLKEDYKKRVPSFIKSRIESAKVLFENHEIAFYIADLIYSPDPILIMQLDDDAKKTFVAGVWE